MEAYDKAVKFWNKEYSECSPVDLRTLKLTVEPGFDNCLKEFGGRTSRVLDFGCGTGDILLQYSQYFPDKRGVGIDETESGIAFAKETAKLSQLHKLHFFLGDVSMLDDFEAGEFDGIILSNVLDVMPEDMDEAVLEKLNRILAPGGSWFIKLNPYYTPDELKNFSYEKEPHHLYEEDGILKLHQETTNHWKRIFEKYGTLERYMEFMYPWQPGLNRLFLLKKM